MSFEADKYNIDKKKKSLTKCNSPCYHVQYSSLYWVKTFLDSEYNGPNERIAKYIYGDQIQNGKKYLPSGYTCVSRSKIQSIIKDVIFSSEFARQLHRVSSQREYRINARKTRIIAASLTFISPQLIM